MTGWDIVVAVVAALALGVSLYVLLWDIRRYYAGLKVVVGRLIVLWTEKNQSVVLLRVSFLNPALKGQLVKSCVLTHPSELICTPYPFEREENPTIGSLHSPNGQVVLRLPMSETLQVPLGISPQQVLVLVDSMLVELPSVSENGHRSTITGDPLVFSYIIFGYDDKEITRCSWRVPLELLTTLGEHPVYWLAHLKRPLAHS